jgi:hypothetical protein
MPGFFFNDMTKKIAIHGYEGSFHQLAAALFDLHVIAAMKTVTKELKIYGVYKKGLWK